MAEPTVEPSSRPRYDDMLSAPGGGTNILRYPIDLATDEGGEPDFNAHPHWVVFYPLVRSTDKRARGLNTSDVFVQEDQNRLDPANSGAAVAAAGAVVGAKTGAGSSLVKSLSSQGGSTIAGATASEKVLSSVGDGLGKLGNVLLGGALGAAAGGTAGYLAGKSQRNAKLLMGSKAIALHVSEKISATYGANWEQTDLGGFIGAAASGNMGMSTILNLSQGESDLGQYGLRKMAKVSGLVEGDRLLNTIEATSKKVENPYKEQLFKNMEFRKFAFDYKFMPRSREEALEILSNDTQNAGIIHTFLRHMHPERTDGGLFLHYPSEFLIVYYYQGNENSFVRKISNCALTNMSIDYGAEGFTTFQDSDGLPSEISIRLEFLELEALTYERIEKGF